MIDCKTYANEILDSIKTSEKKGHLVVISAGSDPASESYIRGKEKDCMRIGFRFTHFHFPEDTITHNIVATINRVKEWPDVTGIIVQLPLPPQIDEKTVLDAVDILLDVDGFKDRSLFLPCTPEGVIHIMKRELGDLCGLSAVIIGRGKLVGKPLQHLLLRENMTVSVCHSHTDPDTLAALVKQADAVIVATGKAKHFNLDCKENAVVIDCGVNRGEDGKLCGDVNSVTGTDRVTPVPGGVGLLTRAMLMRHVAGLRE